MNRSASAFGQSRDAMSAPPASSVQQVPLAVNTRLSQSGERERNAVDKGWKVKPGVAWQKRRRGYDWSFGPRLMLARNLSENGRLTLNGEFLPIKFVDLKSGSRVDSTRVDLGYRHFLNPKLYAGVGYTWQRFSPTTAFREEVARLGGTARTETIMAPSVSIGHQIFKISWSRKGRRRVWPFFGEVGYNFADAYSFGADLGDAGTEYKSRKGLSFRVRPLNRKF